MTENKLGGLRITTAAPVVKDRVAAAAQNEAKAAMLAGDGPKTVFKAKHVFMCKNAPNMGFKVPSAPGGKPDKKIKFTNGVLYVSEDWLAKYIIGLCKSAPDFSALVRYTDLEEANRVAADVRRRSQMGGALKGPVTSAATRVLAQTALADRDAQMAQLEGDPDAQAAMNDALGADLKLTIAGTGKVVDAEGFKPDGQKETKAD